jgi:hypothetical protein
MLRTAAKQSKAPVADASVACRSLSLSRANGPTLQRKCACGNDAGILGECAECQKGRLPAVQRAGAGRHSPTSAPPIVHDVLRSLGQPLDAATRAFMEPRFGHDFSRVRVHADAKAAESARAVNALAYTVGRDMVFAAGRYAPTESGGRRLLAHELAHTVQQGGAAAREDESFPISNAASPAEREAEQVAATIADRPTWALRAPAGLKLARQLDPSAPRPATAPTTHTSQHESGRTCNPAPGYPPSHCSVYAANAWWLPLAYVNNATCACTATPNVPTANCVRKHLQGSLAATPGVLKATAAAMKMFELSPIPGTYVMYQTFVQTMLAPGIYADHVAAYRSCCCPFGPAPYADWIGVTAIPFQPCSLVGWFINNFGSCTGAPNSW